MSFSFVKGDEVVVRARPDAGSGVVTDVLLVGTEPLREAGHIDDAEVATLKRKLFA